MFTNLIKFFTKNFHYTISSTKYFLFMPKILKKWENTRKKMKHPIEKKEKWNNTIMGI